MRDYPEGFHEWPLDKRNAWFELEVKDYALGEAETRACRATVAARSGNS